MDLFAQSDEILETEHNKLWEVINPYQMRHSEKTSFSIAKYICSGKPRYALWRSAYPSAVAIGYYDSAKEAKQAFIREVINK